VTVAGCQNAGNWWLLLFEVGVPSAGGMVVNAPPTIDWGGGVEQCCVGTKLLPLRLL
jgi:hypothetical protein